MLRRPHRNAISILSALVAVGLGGDVYAQSGDFFNSSPGPLAKEHAEWDNKDDCNECHSGGKAVSNSKCLGCHDHNDLKRRISAGEGYHASSKVKGRPCEGCHVEHKGRSFNIMGWRTVRGGEEGFNHELTGWPLREKHGVLECKACHKNKNKAGRRTYLGEDKLCGSCHKRDQPHGFDRRAMMQCERCHTESAWRPHKRRMKFDHNKKSDAEFPQEGAHVDVACGKCHPDARFNLKKKRPGNCRNCHQTSHENHLFDKKACDWCHSPESRSFRKFRFNHSARTRFDLDGKHGTLNCYECHTKRLGFRKPNRNCENCHASDNPHRDRFRQFGQPPRCGTCHPESSFRPTRFKTRHGQYTGFQLTGKHGSIDCRRCHRGKQPYQWENFQKSIPNGQRCMKCHEHKHVHQGQFTDIRPRRRRPLDDEGKPKQHCFDCHPAPGRVDINPGTDFYKDIHGPRGRWPLVKAHKAIEQACDKCHINNEFPGTPTECAVRCHKDSLHEGRLGDECSSCHEPGQWPAVRFDHTDDTTWPLKGLHRSVPECEDCHPKRIYADTPEMCSAVGCHAKDDAHKGRLGDQCDRCHLETGQNIFDHNSQSDYKLDGAHLTTRCVDCHPKITFKPRPTTCYGGGACHPEPDVHKGQFGTVCETCHNTISFERIKPLHDVGAFSLKGAHDRLPCERCHKDNRPLAGTGNFCINCHRQDDVHANSLSPRCGTCHSQWSFAPAEFDHTTVGCFLTGVHRTMPCYDCHKTGNFGPLSPQCASCHRDLALKITTHVNSPTRQIQCSRCHNPNTWAGASEVVPTQAGYGRESICR